MSDSADITTTRLERPVGICPRCRAIARSYDQIGKKCGSPQPSGTRCPGVIRSALASDEWFECPSCDATGRIEAGICGRCNGAGWIYVSRWRGAAERAG